VTVRQCAVLVGGRGSRLGALTAETPKPLLPCGDRPFLAWVMREFIRFGVEEFVLLAGYRAEHVTAAVPKLAALLPRPVRILVSEETEPAGTGGALFHARALLDQRFLLCNGDSLFDTNMAPLVTADARALMLLRRVDDASRYGVVSLAGGRVSGFDAVSTTSSPGIINAGVYLLDRSLINECTPCCSLEADILPRIAASGLLHGMVADGYFRDIGVPEDFARAQSEVPGVLRRSALFLDRDGVVNVDHGYIGSRERFEWTAGALEAISAATGAGWHVFVVTNQSGVARGYYDEAAVHTLHAWMVSEVRQFGGTIDDIRYCPYHEQATVAAYRRASDWRKPAPGMLLDLMRAWELEPERCILIGDQETDMAAARAAGMKGRRFAGGNLADFVRPTLERFACRC